jgi:hypothetical protein
MEEDGVVTRHRCFRTRLGEGEPTSLVETQFGERNGSNLRGPGFEFETLSNWGTNSRPPEISPKKSLETRKKSEQGSFERTQQIKLAYMLTMRCDTWHFNMS